MNKKGFTLIELLIVIGIIGILSGILYVVLDPASQRLKAEEAVMRSNLEKMCLAKSACIAADSNGNPANCDTVDEIGVTNPNGNPSNSTYNPGASTTTVTATLTRTGVSCGYTCTVSTGSISVTTGTCLVQ